MKLKVFLTIILLISYGIVTGQGLCTLVCPIDTTLYNDPGECSALVVAPDVTLSGDCDMPTLQWELTGATSGSGSGQLGTYVFSVGITTVTYTIDDSNGDPSECSYTVQVVDGEFPIVDSCSADIITNNDPGMCSAIVHYSKPKFADNCDGINQQGVLTAGLPSGSSFPVGTTTVTWEYVDVAGNGPAICSFDITVEDNEPPVITCPPDTTIACAKDYFPPDPSTVLASDNCGLDTVSLLEETYEGNGIHPGWCPSTIYRTYIAHDLSGNFSTCMQTITIDDICNCKDCTDNVPHFYIDLMGNIDSIWYSTPLYPAGVRRKGLCCDHEWPDQCISFGILLDSTACGAYIEITDGPLPGGDHYFDVNCGNYVSILDTLWLESEVWHNITFCSPGDEPNQYQVKSISCSSLGTKEKNRKSELSIYPNPTSGTTRISIDLAKPQSATLYIYNLLGHPVAELEDPDPSGNFKEFHWDPEGLPGGMYFVRLSAGEMSLTGKVVVRE